MIAALDDPVDAAFVGEFVLATSSDRVPPDFLETMIRESSRRPPIGGGPPLGVLGARFRRLKPGRLGGRRRFLGGTGFISSAPRSGRAVRRDPALAADDLGGRKRTGVSILLAVWLLALLRRGFPRSDAGASQSAARSRGGTTRSNVNDVAARILAERFGVPYAPSGRRRKVLAGGSPVLLLRVPPELKERDPRGCCTHGRKRQRPHPRHARRWTRRPPGEDQKGSHGLDKRLEERPHAKDKVRVAIIGVGNCATRFFRVWTTTAPRRLRPGAHARGPRRLPRPRHRVQAAIDVVKGKVGATSPTRSGRSRTTHQVLRRAEDGRAVARGMTHDGLGNTSRRSSRKRRADTRHIVRILKETGTDVVVNYLPVGSEEATKWYVEQVLEAGCAFVNACPSSSPRGILGRTLRGGGAAGHRRRHQVAGRRHDHAPRADEALPRPRRAPRPHEPAQRRRQHRLPQHARARPTRVEEDLEDERRHVAARLRHRRGERPRRAVRLRGVADRPQVGVHPDGGPDVRRRAAQHGAEARGVGLAELGGRHHRRRPLREARARQRLSGALEAPSAYFKKSPPEQIRDDEARELVERFITQYARKQAKAAAKA